MKDFFFHFFNKTIYIFKLTYLTFEMDLINDGNDLSLGKEYTATVKANNNTIFIMVTCERDYEVFIKLLILYTPLKVT